MPLYFCRWPNGDCSMVLAGSKNAAVDALDEVGNADGCPITRLSNFMVHFRLADDGELQFDGIGEAAENEMYEVGYPILDEALMRAHLEVGAGTNPLASGGHALVRGAVAKERQRVRPKIVEAPRTELGKQIKAATDAPTPAIERIVRSESARVLGKVKTKGKPN